MALPLICVFVTMFGAPSLSAQVTISVPADQPAIQAGIDAAVDGDTVLVSPGTYPEVIDFLGKAITVQGGGVASTVIDATALGDSVVKFVSGETLGSVLEQFTITGGSGNTSGLGAGVAGGGILCVGSSPTLRDLIIEGNTASHGAGVQTFSFSSPALERCTIRSNVATPDGGGFYARDSCDATLVECEIIDNIASTWGGAAYVSSSSPEFTRCILARNSAPKGSAVIAQATSDPVFDRCTITANVGSQSGAFFLIDAQSDPPFPVLSSSIVYANFPGEITINGAGNVLASFSDVAGGWPGAGNINANPIFQDPAGGDYTLILPSPCIDSGNPASPLDPDGSIADMGALPYQPPFDPWLDLSSGLAGSAGVPSLIGTGDLAGNDPVSLDLSNANPFALSFLVLGLSNLSIPFKGGVLVPAPDFLLPLTVDGFGVASLSTLWPVGVPSGATFYSQFWISDAAGPAGFAASNALSGTTP